MKHLVKKAKYIILLCLKAVEGLDLDNIKVRISRVKDGGES